MTVTVCAALKLQGLSEGAGATNTVFKVPCATGLFHLLLGEIIAFLASRSDRSNDGFLATELHSNCVSFWRLHGLEYICSKLYMLYMLQASQRQQRHSDK